MCSWLCVLYAGALLAAGIGTVLYVYLPDEPDMTAAAPDADLDAMKQKQAFVLGYTGEIGKKLVKELLDNNVFKKLILVGRRQVDDPLLQQHADRLEQRQVDFDNIDESVFADCHVGYCALGTTRGKAGKDGFIKVDHDYVVNAAGAAKKQGTTQFHLVTSAGSNANSFFLYPKTKGQTEEDVKALGFPYYQVYRPAMLLYGPEGRNENRLGEKVALAFVKPIASLKPTLMSCPTINVAKAMVWRTLSQPDTTTSPFVENAEIHQLAGFYDQRFSGNNWIRNYMYCLHAQEA